MPNKGSERRLAAAIATLIITLPFAAAADPIVDCNQTRDATRQLRGCSAYLRLLSADPGNRAVALLNRANIYARDGRYAQALMDYKKARELDPTNALIPYNLGNVHIDLGQLDRAEAALSQAIALDGTFALAYLNRGIARESLGNRAGADEDYRRALELDPTIASARRRLDANPFQLPP
jgi:tetratricopeptide (TPR) repeat protein